MQLINVIDVLQHPDRHPLPGVAAKNERRHGDYVATPPQELYAHTRVAAMDDAHGVQPIDLVIRTQQGRCVQLFPFVAKRTSFGPARSTDDKS
jgi:hypothetical protein